MSHSKRNTSRSVFTSYERNLAKAAWSSNSARLQRDSFLPFGSCYLCLEVARDPVACSHGDIFCRECAVSNLVAQKKEIKRTARARARIEDELRDAAVQEGEDAQQRAMKDFELVQAGLNPSTSSSAELRRGEKRKSTIEDGAAEDDRAKPRRKVLGEAKGEDTRLTWAPAQSSETEALQKTATLAKQVKSEPICPASQAGTPHAYSLKSLNTIVFAEEASDTKTENLRRKCPSCMKTLGNASQPLMAIKCGHVLCRSCIVKLVVPAKAASKQEPQTCFVCDEILATGDDKSGAERPRAGEFHGLIELRSEGTGFSARGGNTIQKQGVAFQC
ncbi:RING finger domain-containing protein [Plectosphaerella plurivora]|uniref:RING finger domain-containing protein n=1 Tax=Plectosphaerella plurivora TaxID=936078 RepID=A0A9P8V0F4_9PEZI|nr:RING finger domain-containing protein [Plectosphaerella plurivora]